MDVVGEDTLSVDDIGEDIFRILSVWMLSVRIPSV